MEDKILLHKKDFFIESCKMTVEFFVWKCPKCGESNRDLEFYVNKENGLYCISCDGNFKY